MKQTLLVWLVLGISALRGVDLITVSPDGEFRSIQAAIDAVEPGGVVRVAAGTYRGNLSIGKAVTLVGAGWDKTRVELPGDTESTLEATWEKAFTMLEKLPLSERQGQMRQAFNLITNRAFFIYGTNEVTVRGMGFFWVGPRSVNPPAVRQLVEITNAVVTLEEVAIMGSPKEGLRVYGSARITLKDSLVAGNWGKGVWIGGREGVVRSARIIDCDIRHNHLSHLTVSTGPEGGLIRGCRLYGSSFFGIRPGLNIQADGNAIFDNARTAFYSMQSSVVISNNLILNNAFGGVSAWECKRHLIVNNTFVNTNAYGVTSVEKANPMVRDNIFVGHANALRSMYSTRRSGEQRVSGKFELGRNLFWRNGTNWTRTIPDLEDPKKSRITVETIAEDKRLSQAPGFVGVKRRDYHLRPDSVARREGMGALTFPSLTSPFPVQPEEKAIIPDTASWSFRDWKKPPSPKFSGMEKRLRALMTKPKPEVKRPAVSYEDAFADLYSTLAKRYPNFGIKNIDWQAVGKELSPRAKQLRTDRDFAYLCYELVARLEDSHAYVGKGLIAPPPVKFPRWHPGFACLLDEEGEPVVYHLAPGGSAEQGGLKVGMRLLSVNGQRVGEGIPEIMKGIRRFSGFSSERYLRYTAVRWLGRMEAKDAAVSVVAESAGGDRITLELKAGSPVGYLPRLPAPNPGIRDSGNVSWKMLEGDIGLIYVRRIRSDMIAQLDQAVAELSKAKGLIIDVRGNSGGGFDFNRAHRNFQAVTSQEPERPRFIGPMALVIDSRCISAGEGWASWFIAKQRAKVFGSTTAGASARKTSYELKNGLFKVTFPIKPYRGYLDRLIERRGLEPDVELRQTAADLAAGRDTVLNAAREYLIGE